MTKFAPMGAPWKLAENDTGEPTAVQVVDAEAALLRAAGHEVRLFSGSNAAVLEDGLALHLAPAEPGAPAAALFLDFEGPDPSGEGSRKSVMWRVGTLRTPSSTPAIG